jgi:hypothetical protein
MIRLFKCPYAFSLLDSGEVRIEDVVGDLQRRFIERGIEFEAEVTAEAVPIAITPAELPAIFKTNITFVGLPLLENPCLRL